MEILALLSNRDDIVIPRIKEALSRFTVYPLKTLEEVEDLYSNIPLNLLLIDTVSHGLPAVSAFLNRLEKDMVVLITPGVMDESERRQLPDSVYDCVAIDSVLTRLPKIVEHALERQRFQNELRLLKQTKDNIEPLVQSYQHRSNDMFSSQGEASQGRLIKERVIINFAKMLTANFDMRKLFDHFMDSVMEIARVSKMSVMLREETGFYVKTHYGLDSYIADNFILPRDSALAGWLTKTGRIVSKPVAFTDSISINIKNEMDLLQCTYSFPLTYKGKLIGIFNIDDKITAEPLHRDELEIIYVLCNYLAAAVKDINLYHEMWSQKEFTKNILSSMNSGVIAIDAKGKITVFNRRASEILGISADSVIGNGLAVLPDSLSSVLYETMTRGTSYSRHEVSIPSSGIPLGVNSYRLMDKNQNSSGAGIVFSDLSDSKKLEMQSRRADNLKAVNDLLAKIAHEVRNPLTSIQTYTQLLNDKLGDDELNKFYISTVSESITRLDNLIDKLVTFSSSQDYNLEEIDVNDFVFDTASYITANIPATYRLSKKLAAQSF
ncbi:PAS domain-containing protein, partial [bacterium]|nr:PAS domain-containing protein [bacterium]